MQGLQESQGLGAEHSLAPQRRLVFEHTIEGLFRISLRHRLSALAWQSLREAGLDLSRPLAPAYPYETWKRALEISVADLYPFLPREEAWRRMGRDVVDGMMRTVMGRAMVGVSRLLGPLRSLRRLNSTLRSADNYAESRLFELSPNCCEVWINEVMEQPSYYQGVLEACVTLAGGRDVSTRVLSRDGHGAFLHVEWKD
ncbi:DUF2378 family protein [Archangium lipolyticum]|uniref:DUF2378 family protein n=1 Tax=Archangium lipolyticum TaxID=2970465 RepID=UPI002149C731|nr:DUF2378 family protein [Archangium lipolyticum]